jgi:hypothetical protein
MPMDGPVIVEVLVVERRDTGWLCEIDHRVTFIGKLQLVPGTSVPGEGHRGVIHITGAAARDLGLSRLPA